jgi:hypothetical protein
VILAAVVVPSFLTRRRPAPAAPARAPRAPLLVSRNQAGAYHSLQEALTRAQRGDVVEILDDVIEENVVVSTHKGKTDVTLRAHPGKAVVWRCPKGGEGRPLLLLSEAPGFRVEGRGITLDGNGAMPKLVELYGRCPGLVVEGLRLEGFTKAAVQVVNCAGTKDGPVRLRDLKVAGKPNDPAAAAIYFQASAGNFIRSNAYIHIGRCDFGDLPPAQAIRREN